MNDEKIYLVIAYDCKCKRSPRFIIAYRDKHVADRHAMLAGRKATEIKKSMDEGDWEATEIDIENDNLDNIFKNKYDTDFRKEFKGDRIFYDVEDLILREMINYGS